MGRTMLPFPNISGMDSSMEFLAGMAEPSPAPIRKWLQIWMRHGFKFAAGRSVQGDHMARSRILPFARFPS
jgi:hypothetical protein